MNCAATNTRGGSKTGVDLFFWRTSSFWVKYFAVQSENICQSSDIAVQIAKTCKCKYNRKSASGLLPDQI